MKGTERQAFKHTSEDSPIEHNTIKRLIWACSSMAEVKTAFCLYEGAKTANRVAAATGVNIRSIYTAIRTLSAKGIVKRGANGGYVVDEISLGSISLGEISLGGVRVGTQDKVTGYQLTYIQEKHKLNAYRLRRLYVGFKHSKCTNIVEYAEKHARRYKGGYIPLRTEKYRMAEKWLSTFV